MPGYLTLVANHLWQSTLVAAVVAALCYALRKNTARTRYWLWLAASVKFLVPFSLLVTLGMRVDHPTGVPMATAVAVEQISASFSPVQVILPSALDSAPVWPFVVVGIWGAGSLVLLVRWLWRWWTLRVIARAAAEMPLEQPVPVLATSTAIEPGLFGVVRPVLLLPQGIWNSLTPEQFDTIVAHELCHLRYRDNLTAAMHMCVETLFWFHPVVWWIGARMVDERERACDESVLAQGRQADVYAEGILNVCKFYRQTPLACASGVTGANLKRRITEIMVRRASHRLTATRRLLLAMAGVAIACVPLVIGILRAQTRPPEPEYTYEVVSIRPSDPGQRMTRIGPGPQSGIKTQNSSTMQLLTFAYDVREFQFADVPDWVKSVRYDVTFTPDRAETVVGPGMPRDQIEGVFNRHRHRMRAVLRDRFGLVLRAETRELSMYALSVGKGGHRLSKAEGGRPPHMMINRGQLTATSVDMKMLTNSLSSLLGRHVGDETGLEGLFDFKMQWTPDSATPFPAPPAGVSAPPPPADPGVSLFTAITEQLGLKLDAKKGQVPVLVIEKIQKPSEN